jgi:hypothetical protein
MPGEKRVVSDPKSDRESSTQNTKTAEQYIRSMDKVGRMDESKLRSELSKVREAMSLLQMSASEHRRKYDYVPTQLREALRASRRKHRDLTRGIRSLSESSEGEEE